MDKEQLKQDLTDFFNKYARNDLDGVASMLVSNKTELNYLVVLQWQEGFDPDDSKTNSFITNDGYGLEASIRVDNGQFFVDDNPYPVVNKQGDCLSGTTITDEHKANGFIDLIDEIISDLETAQENESICMEWLTK